MKSRDEFISGMMMTLAFSALWLFTNATFWVFPLVFAGLLPLVRGAVRFFGSSRAEQDRVKELSDGRQAAVERKILTTARSEGGRVTPALVALDTDISIVEADTALQDMVKLGYATMDITDNGTVEYVFREFLPRQDDQS